MKAERTFPKVWLAVMVTVIIFVSLLYFMHYLAFLGECIDGLGGTDTLMESPESIKQNFPNCDEQASARMADLRKSTYDWIVSLLPF